MQWNMYCEDTHKNLHSDYLIEVSFQGWFVLRTYGTESKRIFAASVRLLQGDRLTLGPFNTGFTVAVKHTIPVTAKSPWGHVLPVSN